MKEHLFISSHIYSIVLHNFHSPTRTQLLHQSVLQAKKLVKMSKQSYKVCCCFKRIYKVKVLEAPVEIKTQFDRYSVDGIMSSDELRRFLIEYQGEDENIREEDVQMIINDKLKEFKHLNMFHRKGLHLEAFFRYLFSDANPPLLPKVHHDMTAPLPHYFIYTGHNSYLTGNQLSSDCSDVPIIKALRKGVRVIELDLWPNSAKDNVHVLHGWTLTTRVELIKCLRAIKEHAFSASPYPVVITLEDHLTPDLQTKVAKMITQTFGDMLFIPAGEGTKEFLSPKSLMNKIMISTKPPKEIQDPKTIKEMEIHAKQEKNEGWGEEVPELKTYHQNAQDVFVEHLDDEDLDDDGDNKLQKKPAPEYKALIAIHGGKHKGGMDEALRINPEKVRRISLSELKLKKAAETHKSHIVRFTEKNFLRVYPKGTRIDSSNYNPLIGWMHGAQMVALNMQGYGRSLWLMQGLFRANGGCGYVKKPDFLLKTHDPRSEIFHFSETLPVKKTLKVHLYMGEGWFSDFRHTHFDMCSPPDFYTRIGIAGVRDDSVMKKTKTIEDEWTPVWDEEFEFSLAVPELALLRIEVHESDTTGKDDFGGQTCLPVSELRTGIRSVPLYSRKGEKFTSVKLLMRFEFV